MILLVLVILGGYAIYVMSPEERLRAAKRVQDLARDGADILAERRAMPEPFRDALRTRTPLAYATGAVAAMMTVVWLFMTLGGGFSDPSGLIGWGASFGPLTTNGEWWRLGASVLVHAGFVHFVINMIGFVPLGIVVERMVGHVAFAVVFLAAGLFAGLESLSAMPMAVVAGADGAIFGIYGLFAAALVWNIRRPPPEELLQLGDLRPSIVEPDAADSTETPAPPLQMTRDAMIRLAPGVVIFVLYHAANGLQTSELSGLVGGFAAGLVLARRSSERTASLVQAGAVGVVALVVILGSAAMLKGIADVRPEIAKVVALESETAGQYEKAVGQFKNGGISSQALAKVISQSIVPELQAARVRLKAVNGVPPEHQPLVTSAEEYLRLRDESWRLRADALRKSNMVALKAADRSERASLEALEKLRAEPGK
jgi:hypothetical protein